MSQIKNIYSTVSTTHKGLEKYYLTSLISLLGNKGVLSVGEQGSGKSVVGISLAKSLSKYFYIYSKDMITLQGLLMDSNLERRERVFCFVDDYSASGSTYAKMNLLTSLCTLNFKGSVSVQKKDTQKSLFFDKFVYIVCLQPKWLNDLLNTNEYVSLIKDKTVRVFFLHRAERVNSELINIDINVHEVDEIRKLPKEAQNSIENLRLIYSKARAIETTLALLNGILKLEGKIENWHYDLLSNITELLALENLFLKQKHEAKHLDYNLIRILGMFTVYKEFTAKDFAKEYNLNIDYSRQVLARYKKYIYHDYNTFKLLPKSERPKEDEVSLWDILEVVNKQWITE